MAMAISISMSISITMSISKGRRVKGKGIRDYVKQVFGYDLPEYKLVSKIKFKIVK